MSYSLQDALAEWFANWDLVQAQQGGQNIAGNLANAYAYRTPAEKKLELAKEYLEAAKSSHPEWHVRKLPKPEAV